MNELLARIEVDFLRELGPEEVAELDAGLDDCRRGCGVIGLGLLPTDARGTRVHFICRGLRPTQGELDGLAMLIVYDTLVYVGHDPRALRIRACTDARRVRG